jgi:hypothetical protein
MLWAAAASCGVQLPPPPSRSQARPATPGAAAGWTAPFGPKVGVNGGNITPFAMDEPFRAWPALNDETLAAAVGVSRRTRLMLPSHADYAPDPPRPLDTLIAGDELKERFARALASRRAVDRKEFFETWEFFARARGSLRGSALVDVAGGHGLLAALFAIFESKRFTTVLVADTRRPKAFESVLAATAEVAPWAVGSIEYVAGERADMLQGEGAALLPHGCAVACVHGCGALTDAVLEAALAAEATSLAVMPCCYGGLARDAPRALRRSLGVALTADIERTAYLEERDYRVEWRALPRVITPLNRIIIAKRGSGARKESTL